MVLRDVDAEQAHAHLKMELDRVRQATQPEKLLTRFASYAVQLGERKIATGKIQSAKGREKWRDALKHHLIPAFGAYFLQSLTRRDIEEWKATQALRIGRGKGLYSPHTVNTWIAILRVVIDSAVAELELDRNPMTGVEPLSTKDWHTFTDESPNSLQPADVPRFMLALQEHHPQFYAMVYLGFATGLRPSSLRPLRRQGPTPDLLLDEALLRVRRSHTLGTEIMERTKTAKNQRLHLPKIVVEVLRWHVETQLTTPAQAQSLFLFPAERGRGGRSGGGMRAPSCLTKPFADVAKAIGITYPVTPKAMRRTFQDLARDAKIDDVVARSVSGHATPAMQLHYSTVGAEEQRDAIGKVANLIDARAAFQRR